jgi:hypothetical protein
VSWPDLLVSLDVDANIAVYHPAVKGLLTNLHVSLEKHNVAMISCDILRVFNLQIALQAAWPSDIGVPWLTLSHTGYSHYCGISLILLHPFGKC